MPRAVATLIGQDGQSKGTVFFFQQPSGGPTSTTVTLSDFVAGDHGLIIHTYGDITNPPDSTGPPFEPGYLGKISVKDTGSGTLSRDFPEISLSGSHSIIGRAFVVHAQASPNPGAGVLWGVIGHQPTPTA